MTDDIDRKPSDSAEDGLDRLNPADHAPEGEVKQALDYFDLTGAESEADMRAAIRDKMSEVHPDRGGDTEAFYEMQDHKQLLEQAYGYSL